MLSTISVCSLCMEYNLHRTEFSSAVNDLVLSATSWHIVDNILFSFSWSLLIVLMRWVKFSLQGIGNMLACSGHFWHLQAVLMLDKCSCDTSEAILSRGVSGTSCKLFCVDDMFNVCRFTSDPSESSAAITTWFLRCGSSRFSRGVSSMVLESLDCFISGLALQSNDGGSDDAISSRQGVVVSDIAPCNSSHVFSASWHKEVKNGCFKDSSV